MHNKYVNSLIKFIQKTKSKSEYIGCTIGNPNTAKNITKRDCVGIHCSHCIFNKSVSINLIETSKNE